MESYINNLHSTQHHLAPYIYDNQIISGIFSNYHNLFIYLMSQCHVTDEYVGILALMIDRLSWKEKEKHSLLVICVAFVSIVSSEVLTSVIQ